MEPGTYDKLATVSVKESKNTDFLRQFAFADGAAPSLPPSELELRKFVLVSALLHLLLVAAGVIILSVFGITICGALFTAWECFCAITAFAAFSWLKSRLLAHLQTQRQDFSQFYEETVRPLVKPFLGITVVSIILSIATIIQGAVVLSQTLQPRDMYFYMGVVTFLYTGLGAGNLVLGVLGLFINLYFLKKLTDFYRSTPVNEVTGQGSTARVSMGLVSMGSVEQLAVTDLTDYPILPQAEPSLAPSVPSVVYSPPSYHSWPSNYTDSQSVSQGSDQTFFDYSSERFQPEGRTVYVPARVRTGSLIQTEI